MKIVKLLGISALLLSTGLSPMSVVAQEKTVTDATTTEPAAAATPAATEPAKEMEKKTVEFTEEFLNDPEVFELGKELWFGQCTHCHGYKAYPGKAPKLKPKRYTAAFVYKRVSKGFRKMPAWDEVYEEEELRALVAYVKHRKFSP